LAKMDEVGERIVIIKERGKTQEIVFLQAAMGRR